MTSLALILDTSRPAKLATADLYCGDYNNMIITIGYISLHAISVRLSAQNIFSCTSRRPSYFGTGSKGIRAISK